MELPCSEIVYFCIPGAGLAVNLTPCLWVSQSRQSTLNEMALWSDPAELKSCHILQIIFSSSLYIIMIKCYLTNHVRRLGESRDIFAMTLCSKNVTLSMEPDVFVCRSQSVGALSNLPGFVFWSKRALAKILGSLVLTCWTCFWTFQTWWAKMKANS